MKENKIRVLHILDELNTGGAEKIVVTYFKYIDKNKFQWDFVITRYEDENKRGMLESLVEKLGGNIYRVHRKRENYIKNILDINKIIKNGNYDIVHSHLDELSTFYLLSAKKNGVKVRICHSHLAGAKRGTAVEILCKLLKPLMNRVVTDKFACGIEAAKSLWGKENVDSGNVFIMNNAIETEEFKYKTEIRTQIRKELNVENNILFGTVGRLSYQKNTEFIIEIFKQIYILNKKAKLLLVGDGEKEKLLKSKVMEYGLNENVIFIKRREDINKIMMALDAFLLPSRYEGLPIVMVEAQCTGLDCFVSNCITKEIEINPNVYYLSLNESSEFWAEFVLNNMNKFERSKGYKNIEKAGYEISLATKCLQDYYEKALEK